MISKLIDQLERNRRLIEMYRSLAADETEARHDRMLNTLEIHRLQAINIDIQISLDNFYNDKS